MISLKWRNTKHNFRPCLAKKDGYCCKSRDTASDKMILDWNNWGDYKRYLELPKTPETSSSHLIIAESFIQIWL